MQIRSSLSIYWIISFNLSGKWLSKRGKPYEKRNNKIKPLKKDLGLIANNHAYEVKMKKPNLGDQVSGDEDTKS